MSRIMIGVSAEGVRQVFNFSEGGSSPVKAGQTHLGQEPVLTSLPRDRRLSDVLFERPIRTFGPIAAVASNIQATEEARLFSLGLHSLAAVIGPSGWGKTHLLEAVASQCADGFNAKVRSAPQWAQGGAAAERSEPLILDNVQDAASVAKLRQSLRIGLERRVRAGKRTFLSVHSSMSVREVRSLLPSSKDWIIVQIGVPTTAERSVIVSQICRRHEVHLGPDVNQLIAQRLEGNGSTLVGAIKRLRLHSQDWEGSFAALLACGILDPYFASSSGWDLREAIAKVAHEQKGIIPRNRVKDLCLYIMLHVAQLNEAAAAQFFRIEPSEAFQRASSFARTVSQTEWESDAVQRIVSETVRFLLQV